MARRMGVSAAGVVQTRQAKLLDRLVARLGDRRRSRPGRRHWARGRATVGEQRPCSHRGVRDWSHRAGQVRTSWS